MRTKEMELLDGLSVCLLGEPESIAATHLRRDCKRDWLLADAASCLPCRSNGWRHGDVAGPFAQEATQHNGKEVELELNEWQ